MHMRIERVPETRDIKSWEEFNERINDLVARGYKLVDSNSKFIVLQKE